MEKSESIRHLNIKIRNIRTGMRKFEKQIIRDCTYLKIKMSGHKNYFNYCETYFPAGVSGSTERLLLADRTDDSGTAGEELYPGDNV